jgi:hypothetical protein
MCFMCCDVFIERQSVGRQWPVNDNDDTVFSMWLTPFSVLSILRLYNQTRQSVRARDSKSVDSYG